MIRVGDAVTLRAGFAPMLVLRVARGCDGTSGDGAGLFCRWWGNRGVTGEGWLSESSVEKLPPCSPVTLRDTER